MTFVQRINEEMVRCGARTVDQEQAYSLRYLGETQGWLQGLTGTVRHSICVQPFEHPVRVRVWFNTSRVTFIRAHLQEWLAVPQIRRKTYSYADFYPEGDTLDAQVADFFHWWDGGV